jgi:hypothetical protein
MFGVLKREFLNSRFLHLRNRTFISCVRVFFSLLVSLKTIAMKSFLYVLLIVIISGCSESILSDIEIEDPSLLKVVVKVQQDEYNNKEVQVFIRDKNNHPVDMLNGEVLVNEHNAPYKRANIRAFNARGYIYEPANWEQSFKITIYWNQSEGYTFFVDKYSGFPGFIVNYPVSDSGQSSYATRNDSFTIYSAPFYRKSINVEYTIMVD